MLPNELINQPKQNITPKVYDFSFEIGDLISTAKYLQRRNKYHEAIRVLSEAVMLKAKPVDLSYGYELMGSCYLSLDNKPNALKYYRQAIDIYSANKNAANMIHQVDSH